MATGFSVHIGLNRVSAAHYGSDFELKGCENDARAMKEIADVRGYTDPILLLGQDATSTKVIDAICSAAAKLNEGDIFFLTFSGHGSQIPGGPLPRDEDDDETWALYDRFLIDDELHELWTKFPAGVRIIVVSDSCHSGTVIKLLRAAYRTEVIPTEVTERPPISGRVIPLSIAEKVYDTHSDLYSGIQHRVAYAQDLAISASVLLLAACGDKQQALDGDPNGVFTTEILEAWQAGRFPGNYVEFWEVVQFGVMALNPYQQPAYYPVGVAKPDFYDSKAFFI